MTNWQQLVEDKDNLITWRNVSPYELPEYEFNKLKESIKQAKEDSININDKLIGHVKEEYLIQNYDKSIEDFIISCATQNAVYDSWKDLDVLSQSAPIFLNRLWVNFQKKHEFNPPHFHSGFVSFVIFVQIPYDLKKEEETFKNVGGFNSHNFTSKLSFLNVGSDGQIKCTPVDVDKSFEGKMLIFNNQQMHEVYPFYTSDDYRITVSGNLKFRV
jgi:hypothetical protein